LGGPPATPCLNLTRLKKLDANAPDVMKLFWALRWSNAHIYFLIGFRNRLVVALNYLTFGRGARLMTGLTGSRMPPMEAVSSKTNAPHQEDRQG
jgi:hypothetical protein